MALLSDAERLNAAWRALAGGGQGEGWRTIPIELGGSCPLLAGRYFPGNEEAVLIGFGPVSVPADNLLPQGHGFRVEKVKHEMPGSAHVWVSLSKQTAGSLDMFSRMAEDVISMLRSYDHTDDQMLFHMFLGRINAWQEFMQRGRADILSPDAEVGLVGELIVLKMLLDRKLSAPTVLDSWQGPLDGLHDFLIGNGAIEVKSSVATSGFLATVGSLEQLDGSLVTPLFLIGIRLSLCSSGKTLPEIIYEISSLLDPLPGTKGKLEVLVLRAGFLWAFSDCYTRRFLHADTRFIPVSPGFPSLTRGNVNPAIRKARYELDLDLIDVSDVGIDRTLKELGVL